jgi:hypothetical protein
VCVRYDSCLTNLFSPSYTCILIQGHKFESKVLHFLALVSVSLVVEKNGLLTPSRDNSHLFCLLWEQMKTRCHAYTLTKLEKKKKKEKEK